jgi:hypothetical protein
MDTTTRSAIKPYTALLADAIGFIIFLLIGNWLFDRFMQTEVNWGMLVNSTIYALFYVVFLVSVNGFKRLMGGNSAENKFPLFNNRTWRVVAALPLILFTLFALLDLSGYIGSVFRLDFGEGGNALYQLLAPSTFVLFALLYIFVVITPVHPETEPYVKQQRAALITLTGSNLLIGASSVYLASFWLRTNVMLGTVGSATLFYLLFVLLFLFPRLLYVRQTGHTLSIASLLAALVFYVVVIVTTML